MIVCGTCGGSLPWIGRLQAEFPEVSEFTALLTAFTNAEIKELANRMPVLVDALDPRGKRELLLRWTEQLAGDTDATASVEEALKKLMKAR